MNYANFDSPATKFLGELLVQSVKLVSTPVNSRFEHLGFRSTSIVVNSMDKVLMIFLLFLSTPAVFLLFLIMKAKSHWFARLIKRVDMSLRYEYTSRFIVEMSMSLGVSSFINIMYGQTENAIDWISIALALLIIIGIT